MASSLKALAPLQVRLLDAFRNVEGVWLTAGAALGGFHLGHRRSHDLDWFTAEGRLVDPLALRLRGWCSEQGLACHPLQEYPGFRRFEVRDGADVRVDPIEEISANKLAALVGRGETKDLVDLYVLAGTGRDVLQDLAPANAKDGAVDPGTLAWVLSSIPTDTSELLLETTIDEADLGRFRDGIVERLQRMAWPDDA